MTGLEKMISQIEEESRAAAQEKTDAAKEQANALLEEAKAQCAQMEAQDDAKRQKARAFMEERVESSMELRHRTALLTAKQELISEVMEHAYEQIAKADAPEYFALLEKALECYVQPEKGQIYFSKADLDRMPESFRESISQIAGAKGGSLELMPATRPVENGFILVYEGTGNDTSIEENCTLRALFSAKKEQLQDIAYKKLFHS